MDRTPRVQSKRGKRDYKRKEDQDYDGGNHRDS